MCTPWLVIDGKQAFVYLLTLCVLEHFVLSHYFWEAFSFCEPWHFLNFKKVFFFFLFSMHSWFWLELFLVYISKNNAKNVSKVTRLSSSRGALWAAAVPGRSL